ncbi:MAG TPA: YihY/virulence factor BrkB family protein, partial [Dehalococcoidia bacterium]|nr:YihY/virulence factor BrkB family protein [Dehalococcoidia bacterium]
MLTKRTVQEYVSDNCSHMAAAISYYVVFSLIPLLIFLVSVFGFIVRNDEIEKEIVDRVVDATPLEKDEEQNLVTDTIRGVSRVSGALSIVGLLGMVWLASAMVGATRRALNTVWGSAGRRPPVQQKLIDLAMVLGLALLLGASVAATTALHTLRQVSNDA